MARRLGNDRLSIMKILRWLSVLCVISLCPAAHLSATERFFTYTYEPESMPRGVLEYEQWVTAAAGRNARVGQQDYNRWEFRHEWEYGVTDYYTLSFYINESLTNFREPKSGAHSSHFQFDGISLE